jgi:hypothetical protein
VAALTFAWNDVCPSARLTFAAEAVDIPARIGVIVPTHSSNMGGLSWMFQVLLRESLELFPSHRSDWVIRRGKGKP